MRTSRSTRRSMVAGFVVVAVGVAGCSGSNSGVTSGSASTNTSAGTAVVSSSQPAATVPPSTSPATTAPGSTAPPSTPVPSTAPALPAVDAADCSLGAPRASITYVVDGQLLELSSDGQRATCLADLPGPLSGPVTWSPAGDRVLLGADTVLDANGVRATGFAASNTRVSWSYPTGKALIAPEQAGGGLTWRNSRNGNDQLDIGFLARTDVAAYHPAGKDIIAAGVGLDGVPGLYLASNRGANARVITTLDDPSTSITDIAVDSSGLMLYFVHDHGDMQHIHRLSLQGLQLGDDAVSTEPIGALTLGADPYSFIAYREGDCDGVTLTKTTNGGSGMVTTAPGLAGRSVSPVGWLDGQQLVVAVRDRGCDGPAEVWVLSPLGGGRQVLPTVEAVSVRTVLSAWGELPDDINAQAPG